MPHRVNRIVVAATGLTTGLFLLGAMVTASQAPAAPKAAPQPQAAAVPRARQPAEAVFKNIQVLKGVPADEFLASMGFIANALAVNCTYCHLGEGGGGWDEYAKDNDKKQTARRMIAMM